MRMIVAGNWKMNTDRKGAGELLDPLVLALGAEPDGPEVIVAPPFPFLQLAVERSAGTRVRVAGQNCHQAPHGAFTGEVSVGMLKSLGVTHVILGHSERRSYFGESDALIGEKVTAALAGGITPIFCCGENREERETGTHFDVVTTQMKGALGHLANSDLLKVVIAYEPVWAIGTGLTATAAQAQEMHAHIRSMLHLHGAEVAEAVPVLYGGSCKPDNAEEIFGCPDVNGGLIGGASLNADQFLSLIRIAADATRS